MNREFLISLLIGISFLLVVVFLWVGLILKPFTSMRKPKDFQLDGDLIIDTKDPHKDILRFELYYDPSILLSDSCDKEFVHFRVIRNNKKEI